MFSKRKPVTKDVQAGAVYQRSNDGRVVEVAKVVSVYDRDGITHVRFELGYQRPNRVDFEGLRVLALHAFSERYYAVAAA